MFDASDGLFHLVFADRNDDYYTPDYLKLKFMPYLRDRVIKAGYSRVYIFGQKKTVGEKNYVLQATGADAKELLKPAKKSLFAINLGAKKPSAKTSANMAENIELSWQEIIQQFTYLLEQMKQNRDIAAVMPAELFAAAAEDAALREELENFRKRSRACGSIIVLLFSPDPDDSDAYFIPSENDSQDRSVFLNSAIFPEIEKALDTAPEAASQLVFHYDALKEAFGDRMMIWNNMSHGAITSAIHYFYLHSADFGEFADVNACANMIWAWYSSPDIREKYYYFDLPSIKTYTLAELMKHFSDPKIRAQIQKGADEENAADTEYILEKYGGAENGIVNRDKSTAFVTAMIKLRNLIRSHGECLDKEQKSALLGMIVRFDRPARASAHNFKKMTFESFAGERRNITEQLLGRLLDSKEWNMWDKAAVRILFIVFDLCAREAEIPCNIDSYHLLESAVSEKCFDALSRCIEKSKNAPFMVEEACDFISKAEKLLYISDDDYLDPAGRSAARERIKNWKV